MHAETVSTEGGVKTWLQTVEKMRGNGPCQAGVQQAGLQTAFSARHRAPYIFLVVMTKSYYIRGNETKEKMVSYNRSNFNPFVGGLLM